MCGFAAPYVNDGTNARRTAEQTKSTKTDLRTGRTTTSRPESQLMRIILMQRGADALYGSFAKRPDVGAWSPTLATKTSSGWGTQAPRGSNPASTCLAAPRATA